VDGIEPKQVVSVGRQPVRLTGKDAFWLHATLAVGLTVCIGAFAFELSRALGGHAFSWMYVFEWPLFAGFAIYMWWNLLQGNDRIHRPSKPQPPVPGGIEAPPDQELEAWNQYVRHMEAEETAGPGRPD
jgi:hypothetical protein